MIQDLINKLQNNSFEIECSEIVLSQNGISKYCGPGEIKQNEDGEIVFKIFCTDSPPLPSLNAKLGKVIDDSEYYSLIAKDLSGKLWHAERLMKNIHSGPTGYIVLHRIDELFYKTPYPSDGPYTIAKMIYLGVVDFPCNIQTVKTNSIDGKKLIEMNRNASKFEACGYEFEVVKQEGFL